MQPDPGTIQAWLAHKYDKFILTLFTVSTPHKQVLNNQAIFSGWVLYWFHTHLVYTTLRQDPVTHD